MPKRPLFCNAVVGLGLVVLLGACASRSPSDATPSSSAPGTVTPPPAGAAPGSVAPHSPLATASPTASPAWTADAAPSGWIYRRVSDPDLEVAVPGDWTGSPVSAYDPAAVASASPEDQKQMRYWDALVSEGAVRILESGPVTWASGAGYQGLTVYVERGDSSLAAFADRTETDLRELFSPADLVRSEVVLPSGPAVVLTYSWPSESGSTLAETDYLIRLADGRSLTLGVWRDVPGATVAGLRELGDTLVGTLRPLSAAATASPGTGSVGPTTPADWPIDLTLPPSWRWTVDSATWQAVVDGLDPVRRTAMEAIGPPSAENWVYPYAVDTASDPLPGGGLTMVMFSPMGKAFGTIQDLEADRRANVPAGATLVGVQQLDGQVGPMVRTTYRYPWKSGEVGMVGYEFFTGDGGYGLSFVIPVEELDSMRGALDSVMASLRLRSAPSSLEPAASATPAP